MRIWSVHPQYLDRMGLVALWRETLLAKHVLEGKTKGYKNHPQLIRFKSSNQPLAAINYYLKLVFLEAQQRNYNFDITKFEKIEKIEKINVTTAQLDFEKHHLLNKLKAIDITKYNEVVDTDNFIAHPLFIVVEGEVEDWEKR